MPKKASLPLLNGPAAAPIYQDDAGGLRVFQGDSLEILKGWQAAYPDGLFDMIFADPPYFLSNGGITCRGGKMVAVDKGGWDVSRGTERNHAFHKAWLALCRALLKPDGTIWITGTHHVIFSVGFALQELGYKLLNDITWEKPNPPPNLSCRYFTHATETVLWAARSDQSRHCFNYQRMKGMNRGKQMKSVWRLSAPGGEEKKLGKHPTQKPLALVERCLLAATEPGQLVLDPFLGGGTTAVACLRLGRRCIGIEAEPKYVELAVRRLQAAPAGTSGMGNPSQA